MCQMVPKPIPGELAAKNASHRAKAATDRIADEHHTNCHDCGQFLIKSYWVRKDHPSHQWALCSSCISNYDNPYDY